MQECKYASILNPNIFDPNLTWPKLFQTERTRRLAHLPSFCELVKNFSENCYYGTVTKELTHEKKYKRVAQQQYSGWQELTAFLRPQNNPFNLSESAYLLIFATKTSYILW